MIKELCRLCGNKSEDVLNVFNELYADQNIQLKIKEVLDISIIEEDPLPHVVCILCVKRLESTFEFINCCHETQAYLKELCCKNTLSECVEIKDELNVSNDFVGHTEYTQQEQTSVIVSQDENKYNDPDIELSDDMRESLERVVLHKMLIAAEKKNNDCTEKRKSKAVTSLFSHIEGVTPSAVCAATLSNREIIHEDFTSTEICSSVSLELDDTISTPEKEGILHEDDVISDVLCINEVVEKTKNLRVVLQRLDILDSVIETEENFSPNSCAMDFKGFESSVDHFDNDHCVNTNNEFDHEYKPANIKKKVSQTRERTKSVNANFDVVDPEQTIFEGNAENDADYSDGGCSIDNNNDSDHEYKPPKKRKKKSLKEKPNRSVNVDSSSANPSSTLLVSKEIETSTEKNSAQQNFIKEKKRLCCSTCKMTFSHELTYEEHLNVHSGNRPFGCKVCEATFRRRQELNQHLRTVHSEKQFKCNMCDYVAKHRGKLTEHRKSVHEKPFVCDICNYRAGEKCKIMQHIASKHTAESSFVCEICGNGFKTHISLNSHRQNIHFPEPKVCQTCGIVCSSYGKYNAHIFRCGKVRKRFTCDTCGRSYTNKDILRDHKNKHLNVKPYKCDVCGKAFFQRNRLDTHKFVHRGAAFTCDICNQSFNRKDNMKNHMKKHFYKSMRCDNVLVTAV